MLIHAYCWFAIDNFGHCRLVAANGASSTPGVRATGPLVEVLDLLAAAFACCADGGVRSGCPPDELG
ncbi:hypothetical protein GCM10022222_30380 [Amycolatopsis ultiminotia]|uniref:Uncharacterized protein n=1 Tax=Amycolatopsis ultiminotia TaxID=543629 RepID=A0ABP6W503_9PSEU